MGLYNSKHNSNKRKNCNITKLKYITVNWNNFTEQLIDEIINNNLKNNLFIDYLSLESEFGSCKQAYRQYIYAISGSKNNHEIIQKSLMRYLNKKFYSKQLVALNWIINYMKKLDLDNYNQDIITYNQDIITKCLIFVKKTFNEWSINNNIENYFLLLNKELKKIIFKYLQSEKQFIYAKNSSNI